MQEPTKKLTGVGLLFTATRLTARNWRYLVWVSLPVTATILGLVVLVQILTEGNISSPPTWVFVAFGLVAVVLILLMSITNSIGWHRLLAHPPQTTPMSVLRKLPYWSYLWRAGCLSIPAFFVTLIIGLPIDLAFRELFEFGIPSSNFADWAITHTRAYVNDWLVPFLFSGTLTLIRFVFPAVALGHKMPLWHTVKSSLTYAPQMMLALVLLEIATFAVIEVAGTRLSYLLFDITFHNSVRFIWGTLILANLIGVPAFMIKVAILTTAYLHWNAQQKRPAEADLLKVFS